MDTDTIIASPYLVRLEAGSSLPAQERMRAETRFSAALEKALGGPDRVVEAYRAFQVAAEAEDEVSSEIAALAKAWQRAVGLAEQAGTRDFGEGLDAYFEIRLN